MKIKGRTGNSIFNAFTSLLFIGINGLLGLVYIKLILRYYGSDFNGVNASATQLINILLVIEGGFTLATNVALFKPLKENNVGEINGILSATGIRFKKMGLLFFVLGVVSSFIYGFFLASELSYWIIIYVFLLSVIPSAFNMFIIMRYKSILLSDQREYVISLISVATVTLGYLCTFAAMSMGWGLWNVKFFPAVFAIINGIAIIFYCKRRYPDINFKTVPNFDKIKGTKDVFIGKILGALYTAAPIFLISIIFPNGAMLVSVYSVYVSVYSLIDNAISAFTSAPRFAFGSLFVENDSEKLKNRFLQYEFIVFIVGAVILGTTLSLILPFVKIYTAGITDIEYNNVIIAVVLGISSFTSVLHIPSGHMINMSGNFKAAKKIQLITLVVLIVSLAIGSSFFGIYGIVAAVCFANSVLAVLEIGYAHKKVMVISVWKTLRLMLPIVILFAGAVFVGTNLDRVNNYFDFIWQGAVFVAAFALLSLVLNLIVNKKMLLSIKELVIKK